MSFKATEQIFGFFSLFHFQENNIPMGLTVGLESDIGKTNRCLPQCQYEDRDLYQISLMYYKGQ